MKTTTYQLEPLSCPSCIAKIETVLGKTDGVEEVQVLFHASKVKVRYEESATNETVLADKLSKLGYPAIGR